MAVIEVEWIVEMVGVGHKHCGQECGRNDEQPE